MDGVGPVALLINSLGSGGAERTAVALARELARRGLRVYLVCLERNIFYAIPEGCVVQFLGKGTGSEASVSKFLSLPLYALRLKRLARRLGIKIVQSHLYRANYVNALARLLGGRHRVQIVNGGQASLYREKGFAGKINLGLIRWLYPSAEVVIAKSEGMKHDLRATIGPRVNIEVINNPYDLEAIRRSAAEDLSELWLPGAGSLLITSVGRLIALKRHRDIIEAFAPLAGSDRRLQLLLLGEGPERPALLRAADRLGVAEQVHLPGNVANPFKYLARSVFLVHASASEGFPNVLAEAMACDCPIIAADCSSGPREILARGSDPLKRLTAGFSIEEAGVLFAVGDVGAMREAMRHLLEDRALADRLVRGAARRCLDFRREAIGERYARLLAG